MARTVARVIVDALSELGVRQVLGVGGDALNPLTDANRTTEGVERVGCRHEEAAAFAASAQSQLSGTLGVCMGTVGPGSVHLLNGLYDAAKSPRPGDRRPGTARRTRHRLLPGSRQRRRRGGGC